MSMDFLGAIGATIPLIFPLHHRTRHRLQEFGIVVPQGVRVIDPLGYIPFLALIRRSAFILTDSGGIQEEAVFLRKRCFTLRKNTERPSTIGSGSNVLIDTELESDRQKVLNIACSSQPPTVVVPLFWDGNAGERIAGNLQL